MYGSQNTIYGAQNSTHIAQIIGSVTEMSTVVEFSVWRWK